MMLKGDTTGPVSAEFILKDPTVDFAVLETARGGILRAGLGFGSCEYWRGNQYTGRPFGPGRYLYP